MLVTQETIPVREPLEKLDVKPAMRRNNAQDVIALRSGPFNMVIFIICEFLGQADFNWDMNHELIYKYWVLPFGHKSKG